MSALAIVTFNVKPHRLTPFFHLSTARSRHQGFFGPSNHWENWLVIEPFWHQKNSHSGLGNDNNHYYYVTIIIIYILIYQSISINNNTVIITIMIIVYNTIIITMIMIIIIVIPFPRLESQIWTQPPTRTPIETPTRHGRKSLGSGVLVPLFFHPAIHRPRTSWELSPQVRWRCDVII